MQYLNISLVRRCVDRKLHAVLIRNYALSMPRDKKVRQDCACGSHSAFKGLTSFLGLYSWRNRARGSRLEFWWRLPVSTKCSAADGRGDVTALLSCHSESMEKSRSSLASCYLSASDLPGCWASAIQLHLLRSSETI